MEKEIKKEELALQEKYQTEEILEDEELLGIIIDDREEDEYIHYEELIEGAYDGESDDLVATMTEIMPTNTIVVGSQVNLRSGAVWYGTSTVVPEWARTRTSTVLEIIGNRVVITYNGAIVGAVRLQDLILVSGGGTGGSTPPAGGGTLGVGSQVLLAQGAVWYGTSSLVPDFVRTRVSTLLEIIGNRAVITYNGAIVGAVRRQDLILVSGGGTGGSTPPAGGGTLGIGSQVRLAQGAVWYGTSSLVPDFVRTRVSTLLEIIGNRAVITYNGAIVGAVRRQDLILVSGGGTGGSTPPAGGGDFVIGSQVQLSQGAVWYGTSTPVPDFARLRTSTLLELINNRAVITYNGAIVGAVRRQDLILVSGGGTMTPPPSGGGITGGGGAGGTLAPLIVDAAAGIVTSANTSLLNIVTQTGAHGWNATFNPPQTPASIQRIAVHHTAGGGGGPFDMTLGGLNATWASLGWAHGGYHFVIRSNGEVWQVSRINRTSNGVGNHNLNTIHIAIMGEFRDGNPGANGQALNHLSGTHLPSPAQRAALRQLVQGFISHPSFTNIIGLNQIFGHRDFAGHASNPCPGYNRNNLHAIIQNNEIVLGDGNRVPAPTPSRNFATPPLRTYEQNAILSRISNFNMYAADALGVPFPHMMPQFASFTTIGVRRTFLIGPTLIGRYIFQHHVTGSSPLGISVVNGVVQNPATVDNVLNMIISNNPGLNITLNRNRFLSVLGSFVWNGTAELSLEIEGINVWITLRKRSEMTLPSGRIFSFEHVFQITPVIHPQHRRQFELAPVRVPQGLTQDEVEKAYEDLKNQALGQINSNPALSIIVRAAATLAVVVTMKLFFPILAATLVTGVAALNAAIAATKVELVRALAVLGVSLILD